LLNLAGAEDALADACGTFDLGGAAEICVFHGRNFDVDVGAMVQAGENVAGLIGTEASGQKPKVHLRGIEVVTDKGYHSGRDVVPHEVFFLARRIQKASKSSLSQIQAPSLQRT
jgi:hypothetical protein